MNRNQDSQANQADQRNENGAVRFPVVGIGASAGGIQALQLFFQDISPDFGMAFIVVMHLSPDYESNLAHVIQQKTSMPVMVVTEPTEIASNHIYVIAPGKHLTIVEGRLLPVEP